MGGGRQHGALDQDVTDPQLVRARRLDENEIGGLYDIRSLEGAVPSAPGELAHVRGWQHVTLRATPRPPPRSRLPPDGAYAVYAGYAPSSRRSTP